MDDRSGVGMMKTTVYHDNHTVSLDEVLDGTNNPGLVYTKRYALGDIAQAYDDMVSGAPSRRSSR